MREFLDFLIRLGLRHPSEPTVRVMALSILFMTEGFEKVMAMSPETKLGFVQSVKQMFKGRAKFVLAPTVWIFLLPRSIDQLKREYPLVYEALYTEESPSASPISELELEQMKVTTRMRAVKSSVMQAGVSCAGGSLMQFQGIPPQLMQFGLHLMNEVAQLKNARADASLEPPPRPLIALRPSSSSLLALRPQAPKQQQTLSALERTPSQEQLALLALEPEQQPSSGQASDQSSDKLPVDEVTKAILDKMQAKRPVGSESARGKGKEKAKAKSKGVVKGGGVLKSKAKAKTKGTTEKAPAMPTLEKMLPSTSSPAQFIVMRRRSNGGPSKPRTEGRM